MTRRATVSRTATDGAERGIGTRSATPGARGFSLIELLIAVAIIGILAGIAYPSYGKFVTEARRTDAHLALLEQRQSFERCRTTRYSYAACTLGSSTSPEGHYTLSIATGRSASAFTLVATATGAQANDTACKTLTIDERERTLGFDADGNASSDCWN